MITDGDIAFLEMEIADCGRWLDEDRCILANPIPQAMGGSSDEKMLTVIAAKEQRLEHLRRILDAVRALHAAITLIQRPPDEERGE